MKLNEGFEVDDNELSSLQDKKVAMKALIVFNEALLKWSAVDEKYAVREIFEEAEGGLVKLYEKSKFFHRDFYRVNGQLLKCFNQKVISLNGIPEVKLFGDYKLSVFEQAEYESMEDQELRTIAKSLYSEGKKRLKAAKTKAALIAEWDVITAEIDSVYGASDAKGDWGKWIFMLNSCLKSIVDGRKNVVRSRKKRVR